MPCECSGWGNGDMYRMEQVDTLQLPSNLAAGEWVLGWRWDCEGVCSTAFASSLLCACCRLPPSPAHTHSHTETHSFILQADGHTDVPTCLCAPAIATLLCVALPCREHADLGLLLGRYHQGTVGARTLHTGTVGARTPTLLSSVVYHTAVSALLSTPFRTLSITKSVTYRTEFLFNLQQRSSYQH